MDTHDQEIEVRKRRSDRFFPIDNEVLDEYAPKIGYAALAVYAALMRFADRKTGKCWPSIRTLCAMLKMGPEKLIACLHELENHNLLLINKGEKRGLRSTYWVGLPDLESKEEPPVQFNHSVKTVSKAETGCFQGRNGTVSKVETEQELENKNKEKENTAIPDFSPQSAAGLSNFKTFASLYPISIAHPRYNDNHHLDEARKEWSKHVRSQGDADAACRSLETFGQSLEWLRDDGKWIPSPAKFIREEKWRTPPEDEDGAKVREIHAIWIKMSRQPKTLNELTPERYQDIARCWRKCVKGCESAETKPMELIENAIEGCLKHWEDNGKRKATLDDVFGSTEKFERCLDWAGYR